MKTPNWTGCPAGCPVGGLHSCGAGSPIASDERLYDCVAAFIPDRDRGVRLTCARQCRGACSLRDAA